MSYYTNFTKTSASSQLVSCIKASEVHRCSPKLMAIYRLPTSFLRCRLVSDRVIQLKPPTPSHVGALTSRRSFAKFGTPILLDLTAAFDTVDHDIMVQCLQQTFCMRRRSAMRIGGFGRVSSVGYSWPTFVAVLFGHSSPVC